MALRFALALLCCSAAAQQTFVLSRDGKTSVENEARASERFPPCSTFKIPNSLIALETLAAPDPMFRLEYDPQRDGEQQGAWARNHDLRSAVRVSAAWYFRELARRVGADRMQRWVDRFNYGNRKITPAVDRFWLGQDLAISAVEQVAFLERFQHGRLGVSAKNSAAVKDIIRLETTPEYSWYGKTGSCRQADGSWVLWHVGFVERDGAGPATYALNLSGAAYAETAARRARTVREKLAGAGLIAAAPPDRRVQMAARVHAAARAFAGEISLYGKNLDTGEEFGMEPDRRVRTASTIKLPIMAAAFAAVKAGTARWEEPVEMRESDKVSGSGVIREFAVGTKLTLRDLVHMMIVVSDNTATNLVLDRITADFVNAEMDKLGLRNTRSMRKVLGAGAPAGHSKAGLLEENKPFGLGASTPREMVTLIEKLERGEVVNPAASREMLDILGRQQYKDGIGRRRESEVASKSGALDALRSDVGLVRSAGGRIAIAVTIDKMPRVDYSPDNAGNLLISDLSELLIEGLSAPVLDLGDMERAVELQAAIDHVQGLYVEGDRAWVSWVDRKARTGYLGEFSLATGKLVRSVEVHQGERFHPGGIAGDGRSIWVPVAEYKARSSAVVQCRNKDTLVLENEFAVADHIGCVAVLGERVFGGNWDSRILYEWDRSGHTVASRPNPAGTRYQDLKAAGGALIGSGLRGDEGAIDWLDPADLRLRKRVLAGKSSRGVVLTHEGMAIDADRLYLVPEDGPSRILVYPVPR